MRPRPGERGAWRGEAAGLDSRRAGVGAAGAGAFGLHTSVCSLPNTPQHPEPTYQPGYSARAGGLTFGFGGAQNGGKFSIIPGGYPVADAAEQVIAGIGCSGGSSR